jgi:transglutaminase-like putative cysteine protease
LAIHDWVAGNIAYDVAKYRSGKSSPDDGALKTLQTHKGVCQDYSYLTVALMRSAGMEARVAVGRAQGYSFGGRGEWGPHAWVEVRIAGRWVVLDPTWDAGTVSPDGRFQRAITRTYFDPKPEVFARDHQLLEYQY